MKASIKALLILSLGFPAPAWSQSTSPSTAEADPPGEEAPQQDEAAEGLDGSSGLAAALLLLLVMGLGGGSSSSSTTPSTN